MKRRPIIIDCDPGQDDAVAIFMAFAAKDHLKVLGITTVAGNVPLLKTYRNARIVCEWAGRPDVPVYAGCERPLMRSPVSAENIHGDEGLSGPELHKPEMPLQNQHAVDYLIETLQNHEEKVTICALGPLTNIAVALAKVPSIATRIGEIVLMGGAASEGGNITPSAEFNFFADPHSAKLVLECGAPITMLPLDVTHRVLVTADDLAAIKQCGTRVAHITAKLLASHGVAESLRFNGGTPLHDPCVVAYLLDPLAFSSSFVNVAVETQAGMSLGSCVVDRWSVTGRKPNVRYVHDGDSTAVISMLKTSLLQLP
jgi:purine nucleosidase